MRFGKGRPKITMGARQSLGLRLLPQGFSSPTQGWVVVLNGMFEKYFIKKRGIFSLKERTNPIVGQLRACHSPPCRMSRSRSLEKNPQGRWLRKGNKPYLNKVYHMFFYVSHRLSLCECNCLQLVKRQTQRNHRNHFFWLKRQGTFWFFIFQKTVKIPTLQPHTNNPVKKSGKFSANPNDRGQGNDRISLWDLPLSMIGHWNFLKKR